MARAATGQIVERKRKAGTTFAIRFRAYGKREFITLGTTADGWTHARAETELMNVLADVRRGLWRPPTVEPTPEPPQDWTFHEWASKCLADRRPRLRPRAIESWEWALSNHLLPAFGPMFITEITKIVVHEYVTTKVRERELDLVARPLSNSSINRTVARLADLLEDAVEFDLITTNPAKSKRLKLPAESPKRRWLQIYHVMPMIDAARQDRALIATLLLAGLRIGEALAVEWGDVDLNDGSLLIRVSKTPAGVRMIDLTPMLKRELAQHKLRSRYSAPGDPVFATETGTVDNRGNVLKRAVRRSALRVNVLMAQSELAPMPEDVTIHDLRRVFSSLLDEVNAPRAYKDQQMGHRPDGLASAYDRPFKRERDIGKRIDELLITSNPFTNTDHRDRHAS